MQEKKRENEIKWHLLQAQEGYRKEQDPSKKRELGGSFYGAGLDCEVLEL